MGDGRDCGYSAEREQRLIDVPISISVVSDKQLKLMGIDNMTDLSFIVPSLTVNEDSAGDQQVTIRGVSNERGTSPLVGIYLDEIPLRLHSTVHLDLPSADIERVEVLKGPQGTLFGQGATGGVIRYISKSPSFDALTGDVSARFYDTKEGDMSQELIAAVNVPVVADKFAVRIAANHKDIGGWIDQLLVDDENFNDEEVTNIRIRGLLQVMDGLDVDATVVRHRSDAGGSKLVNVGESSESNYLSILSDPDGEGASLNSPGISYEYDVYNITVSYDMGFATLVSSSSKYNVEHDENSESSLSEFDLGGPTLFLGSRQGVVRDANALAQEIRLSGDTESMGWNLGVFYTDVDTFISISSDGHILDQNTYENILLLAPFTSIGVPSSSNSTAVFGDVSYHLTEEITASFGARYYEDKIESVFSGENLEDEFDNLSLKGSLSYALSDNMNIYFSVAEGFRSGGVNIPNGQPFEPENLISYELGSKAEILEGRLNFELAMYFSEYDDYQENIFLTDGTFTTIIQNPGSAELKGVEWSIGMNLTEQLSLGFNGNIAESEFTKVAENPNIFEVGDSLNGVPNHSYSISVDYGFNLTSSIEGFAHADYSRTGESKRTSRGNVLVGIDDVEETAAVGYLNAQLGLKWESMTIKLFGKNLNNELRSPNSGAALTQLQRRPRTIGVDLSYAF